MNYDLDVVDGGSHLDIEIEPRRAGRANLQFGTRLRTDFDGDSTYALLIRHQWLALNRRGAEWVNTGQVGERSLLRSEFLQPLDWGLHWYVKPAIEFNRLNQSLWFDGVRITEYEVREARAAVDFGRFLGNWGDLRLNLFRGRQRGGVQIGLPAFPAFDDDLGGFGLGFDIDTRDLPMFPNSGTHLRIEVERNVEAFGATEDWTLTNLRWQTSFSAGRSTITPRLEALSNFEGYSIFSPIAFVGGFQRLSGLGDNELIGDRGGVFVLDYHYELFGLDLGALNSRVFAGATLEAGNTYLVDEPITWRSLREGASVYLGASTPIGPVYFGAGWTEPGRTRLYLSIGAQFLGVPGS